MKINYKIVSGVLAAMWLYEARAAHLNGTRLLKLVDNHKLLLVEYGKAVELANLYASKLTEAEVPIDEFTQIVMDHLTE